MSIAQKICKVDGCDRLDYIETKRLILGYCPMHYARLRKLGTTGSFIPKRVYGQDRKKNPLYSTYLGMMTRCNNKNTERYDRYGGRGITVFSEWAESQNGFKNYEKYVLNVLGERPSLLHTIDRIDNTLGYQPGNLRWADKNVQSLNRNMQANNSTGHFGVYVRRNKSGVKWFATIKLHRTIRQLGTFETFEEAVEARKKAEKKYHEPILQNA